VKHGLLAPVEAAANAGLTVDVTQAARDPDRVATHRFNFDGPRRTGAARWRIEASREEGGGRTQQQVLTTNHGNAMLRKRMSLAKIGVLRQPD
jgi:hypothetical protein